MSSKTRSKKEESPEPPPLIPSLPEDIIINILARVERCYYPKLSLVSKRFRSLVTSHEIYERRSSLGCTEHSLYVVLYNRETGKGELHILRRNANGSHRLVLIPGLPDMPAHGSFVAVGSRMYVFGRLNSVISIDCRSHTVHLLPSMNVSMSDPFADIIDGKIYVTGYCNNTMKMVMTVFNTETQMWEPKKTMPETMGGLNMWPDGCVVMAGKMYTRDNINSFVFGYDPKESKWEMDNMLNMFRWRDACVVDDVLYYYDWGGKVRAYDPKESSWVVVNGLEKLVAEARFSDRFYTGSYSGKLALFFWNLHGTRVIRCAEISLERRQGKEIWGKVEWCDDVLLGGRFKVMKTLDVIV
ncbi:hypothetical protein Bca52824_080051 [Brassica carinata]|uniref:F-box domain-containing protein n=1 Tax=Brassica carinata TaxID=52824 RepID=A0A8X7Q197_BRACI|nr:hypothetical protein Bca52824_080051 [Brassica carinata]